MGKMKIATQDDKVLNYLKKYGNIDTWTSITEYGATRLSAIIYRLRNQGYNISGTTIKARNRYDEPTHYTLYSLNNMVDKSTN